jgi:hypothetical protein
MKYDMKLISHDELMSKLERKDNFKLVMALGTWEYRAKYIPGSLHFLSPEEALASLTQGKFSIFSLSRRLLARSKKRTFAKKTRSTWEKASFGASPLYELKQLQSMLKISSRDTSMSSLLRRNLRSCSPWKGVA